MTKKAFVSYLIKIIFILLLIMPQQSNASELEIYSNAYKVKKDAIILKRKSMNLSKQIEWCIGERAIFKSSIQEYDQNGNIVKKIQNDNKNNLYNYQEYAYNNGLLSKVANYSNNNSIISTSDYSYDDNNRISIIDFKHSNQSSKIYYAYDNNSCLIEKKQLFSILLSNKHIYEYDCNFNLIKDMCYLGINSPGYKSIYEYDKNNNLISVTTYDKNNQKGSKETYKYDNNGNLVETMKYDGADKVFKKIINIYDNSNNLLKEKIMYNSSNKAIVRYFYEYVFFNKPSINYNLFK
ncbi:MAG: hypothetical protein QMC67_12525 [Candidatus Wallbacteria bacterium]